MAWHFTDPFPDLRLMEIAPISVRALSWLARASKDASFPHQSVVQIAGGAKMLGGLEYHHQNFMRRFELLTPMYGRQAAFIKHALGQLPDQQPFPASSDAERVILDELNHEAIAYINRLGQFFTFAKSCGAESFLPRAAELMLFRHKHTAHRSIDAPRREDTSHLQEVHAMSFGFHHLGVASFPIFQIHDQTRVVDFHMRDDHALVMIQAFDALQSIHHISQ